MRKIKKNAESRANSSSCGVVAPKKVRDSAESQNLVKKELCEAPLNSPASWCKKSESKGAEVPPADFLLEAEKRGSPPKSEKRSFWRVGGAGRGVQPFCEKESSEISDKRDAKSIRDLQGGLLRSHLLARNDEILDSSLRKCSAQNDKNGVRVAESSKKSACESLKKSLDSAPSSQNLADLDALQKNIKYYFKDENLLRTALTHKSFDKHTNNERLEFLGDAVMDLIIGEYVFLTQERGNEGDLTRIRAAMVNENSLANLANNINLGKYLFISFSESRNKGRKKPSILSDAFEALMGAIYLDGGLESARSVAHLVLEKQYKEVEIESLFVDYKSALQELTQAICGNLPKYVLLKSSGPDHSKKFTMQVLINGEEFATARGKSKKEAEQECAKIAYNRIKKERL